LVFLWRGLFLFLTEQDQIDRREMQLGPYFEDVETDPLSECLYPSSIRIVDDFYVDLGPVWNIRNLP
jgi:hypothetical protein